MSIEQDGGEVKQTREDWANTLQPGDEVVITASLTDPIIAKFIRCTATQVIVGEPSRQIEGVVIESRFDKKSGREKGDHLWTRWLNRDVEGAKAILEHKRLCNYMSGKRWDALTGDQLRRIEAICKEGTA